MLALVLAVLALWLALAGVIKRPKRKLPLPPSPPADPLIGHLRIFPKTNAEDLFCELGKTYGASPWIERYDYIDIDQGTLSSFTPWGSQS